MLIIESKDFKQKPFPIWRGFRHSWLYNHRTNRIGSFISQNKANCYSNHSGASGTGPDMLNYQDEFSIIDAENTSFVIKKVSFNLIAKKGHTLPFRKDIIIKTDNADKNRNFGAVLNGFDLVSTTNSSKMHLFDIRVEKVVKKNQISYAVIGNVNLDCKSLECTSMNGNFNYDLDVYVLIVKGEDFNYVKDSGSVSKRYSWKKRGKKNEIHLYKNGIVNDKIIFNNNSDNYNDFAVGYRRISLVVHNQTNGPDKSVHMLDLNININDFRKTSNNCISVNHEIFFRNWRKGMQHSGYMSFWSFGQKGSFEGFVKLGILKFKNAKVKLRKNSGQIEWKGKDLKATSSSALKTNKIDFDFDLLAMD